VRCERPSVGSPGMTSEPDQKCGRFGGLPQSLEVFYYLLALKAVSMYIGTMSRRAPVIDLQPDEREVLERWSRSTSVEKRFADRAVILLDAADGMENKAIAEKQRTRVATVSKWRRRFHTDRLQGLQDAPRPGAKPKYDERTVRRVLALLDKSPPKGFSQWSGPLLAKALGDVSEHQIWRILRERRISLTRRRSWCISTDPEFVPKAADIVGLYMDPPENAVVICVDEKPAIQALERAQGWLRLPNGRALTGFNHEYKRHGTTTLFAALEVATGLIQAKHFTRRRRREFLAFMNEVVAAYPDQEIHVVLDNLRTHKPKHDRWIRQHKNVHFHYTPTHASWLNMVEVWFSILWLNTLRGASWTSPRQVRQAIDAFCAAYNETAHPFIWTKANVKPTSPKHTYSDLCK